MRDYISIKNLKRLGNKKNIYVLDENFLLKIYEKSNKNNSDERILRCYYNYKFLYKSGFPTPNIYKIVDTEYGIGFVMDYLPGKTISNMIKLKPYKMIKYLRKYGDIVKKMHNMELNKNEFVDVKKHLIDLYGVVRGKYLNLFLEDEFRKILEIIEKVPNRNTLIHGDCNDGNFLVDGAESYIIDLDTVAIGHPIFDLAEIRAKKKFFEYDKIILNRNYTENRIKKRKLYELQKERLLCEVFWFFL